MNNTLDFGDGYVWDEQEFKYLKVKTQVIIAKLKEKYPDIVTMDFETDPGNLRIGFQQWGPNSKFALILGNKGQDSFWINNVEFKTKVKNNGKILNGNLNSELTQIYEIIEQLIIDYSS